VNRIFLGYSHEDRDVVRALEQELQMRGVHVWRDEARLAPGMQLATEIEGALSSEQETYGYMAVMTDNVLKKESPILIRELKIALERKAEDPNFPVIILRYGISSDRINELDAWSRKEVSKALSALLQREIRYRDGSLVVDDEFQKLTQDILKAQVRVVKEKLDRSDERRIEVHLRSKDGTIDDSNADFTVDLNSFFQQSQVPGPETWKTRILPALCDLKQVLVRSFQPTIPIDIYPKSSLPEGFAFGYICRATSGLHLVPHDALGVAWPADKSAEESSPLSDKPEDRGSETSSDVILEIGISGRTGPKVDTFIKQCGLIYQVRARMESDEPSPTFVRGPQHAIDIAEQIQRKIVKLHHRFPDSKLIHVFYRGPLALTILIGSRLNALGRFQFYEYTPNGYVPSVRLGDRDC